MTADGSDRSFGAPRFDVVLRGYDRRQVDEHLARLQRLMGRMRSDLDTARGRLGPPPAAGPGRPTPRPRPDGPLPAGANDVVGTFTDRMHAILQSAEEEAAEIRNKARAAVRADEERAAGLRAAVRAEEDAARRTLADLVRQRDAVLAELTRVRGQLEGLLSGPTARITLPTQESGPERHEVGAGQPLPGTPELFEPAPEGEPVAVAGGAPAGRAATTTGGFPGPGDASTEPAGELDEPAADRIVTPAPAEQTLLMEPLTDEPAPEAEQVESTQSVAPPVGGSSAHDQDADDSGAGSVETPTQVAPASPARSG
jgi:DivIVA domain-containing protein